MRSWREWGLLNERLQCVKWHDRKAYRAFNIKAEMLTIPQIDSDGHNNNWYREPQAIINDALQIINKHIGESEDKE